MTLYLMQHGQAASDAEDPERPLTAAGRVAVRRVAARARAGGVRVEQCAHSGKLRAAQSAELLMAELGAGASAKVRPGLAPMDPVAPVADWLRAASPSLALVGHLPFLGRLASLLVAGDEDAQVVAFRMGGLVALEAAADGGGFSVAWALPPELA